MNEDDIKKIEDLFRHEFYSERIIRRFDPPRSYGASGIGFCLNKIVLTYLHRESEVPVNLAMLEGTMFHRLFRQVAKKYFKLPFYRKIVFEKIVKKDFGDFTIEGHADAYIPSKSLVIEFKTTGMYETNELMLNAYKEQANIYASILNARNVQIWIFHKTIRDFYNKGFFSIIEFENDPTLFENSISKLKMVDNAINNQTQIIGTEFQFECKYCPFIDFCDKFDFSGLFELLPCPKSVIESKDKRIKDAFNLLRQKQRVKYNRGTKNWEVQ